jgi:hypothetical protein
MVSAGIGAIVPEEFPRVSVLNGGVS